ncbi:TA system VapC family ribonuclease toxin [Limnohabitans sp. Rim8]|jgi:toxin-antitoxin system PIN domain toxin|uniref:TA system VapC family ribonuclease toxin n=1 Tax=Limnohabitans sp. Rim8 TaxID=1100718 RepID=UPI0025E70F81|nr:TA system VapC family ribonuclease toxin [Limnohabitans sp. Rim8]
MRALFDVNVLIALHDRDHVHHVRAAQWFEDHIHHGWATCALTQNGCLRIMGQPGYSSPQPILTLLSMLQNSTRTAHHAFWSEEISLLDPLQFQHGHIHSARQLTDLYLLALAVKQQGRLVTLDQRIPISAVRNATPEHLVVL